MIAVGSVLVLYSIRLERCEMVNILFYLPVSDNYCNVL